MGCAKAQGGQKTKGPSLYEKRARAVDFSQRDWEKPRGVNVVFLSIFGESFESTVAHAFLKSIQTSRWMCNFFCLR